MRSGDPASGGVDEDWRQCGRSCHLRGSGTSRKESIGLFEPRLGVSLHTISGEWTRELYEALRASAIATVEITARYFTGQSGDVEKSALNRALREAGIQAASIHALFGPQYDFSVLDGDAHERAIDVAISAIDLAAELEARLVVVHASAEPIEAEERGERMAQARRALAALSRRCQATGTRIAIELLPRTCLGNTVDELLGLLDGLDAETLGVCLDTNHLMDRYDSLPDDVRRLGERLMATHLSDYDGVDEKHELPGTGVVDWTGTMAALRDIDYRGPFNYECKLDGDTPEERIAVLEGNFEWLCGL